MRESRHKQQNACDHLRRTHKIPENAGLVHGLEKRPDRVALGKRGESPPEQLDHSSGNEAGGKQDPRQDGEPQKKSLRPQPNKYPVQSTRTTFVAEVTSRTAKEVFGVE